MELESVILKAEEEIKEEFNHKSIKELWVHAWKEFCSLSVFGKIIYVFEYPFTILRDITCPVVDDERWHKYWLLLTSFGAPFAFCYFTSSRRFVSSTRPQWISVLPSSPLSLCGHSF